MAPATVALAVNPDWRFPLLPNRAVFEVPDAAEATVVVAMDIPDAFAREVSMAAVDPTGQRRRLRVLRLAPGGGAGDKAVGPARADVLVDVSGRRGKGAFALYVGPAGVLETDAPPAQDAAAVLVEMYRLGGKSVPNSWPRLLTLFQNAGEPWHRFLCNGVAPVNLADIAEACHEERVRARKEADPADDAGRDRRRHALRQLRAQQWGVRLQTVVYCPADEVYRFAVRAPNIGYVRVDGEQVAGWTGRYDSTDWHSGAPVFLRAGAHRVEVFTHARGSLDPRMGWRRADERDTAPIPSSALLSAFLVTEPRREALDQPLHPDFAYDVLPGYALLDYPGVFVPVRLTGTSVDWLSDDLRCRWVFPGGAQAEGPSARHVLAGQDRFDVVMEVRDALGFTGACRKTIDTRLAPVQVHALAAVLADLAPVAYAEDILEPMLEVRGDTPAAIGLLARWTVRRVDGRIDDFSAPLRLEEGRARLPVARASAGELERIDWRVEHAGVAVREGVVRFVAPPFPALPAAVEADRVYTGAGEQLVMVPHRRAGLVEQPFITIEEAFGRIVCVDDFLARPGLPGGEESEPFDRILARIVDGPDRPVVRHVPLSDWESAPEAFGPLQKLVQIPRAVTLGTDVVVISVALRDVLAGVDPDVFERQIAAIADLVAFSMDCPVIWVTPPPYPSDPERVRPYAVAIRRVAAARRMPVADVFTAFIGMRGESRPFFRKRDLALSASGQVLSAQVIARALLGEKRHEGVSFLSPAALNLAIAEQGMP